MLRTLVRKTISSAEWLPSDRRGEPWPRVQTGILRGVRAAVPVSGARRPRAGR